MPSARRIDVHCHIIPPFYQEAVKAAGLGPTRLGGYPPCDPAEVLEQMDRNEVQTSIPSVAMPGVLFLDPPAARTMARRLNEYSAGLRQRWPGRFGAFAMVPMQNVDDAIGEIEYALDVLKFEGVCLFASYGEKFLGDPGYEPIMAALNERKAVVFTHPTLHASSRQVKLPYPAFLVEYPFDTTRMAVNLMLGGVLERYPDIKVILSHGGGTLPYLSWRIATSPQVDAGLPQWSREKFDSLFRRFYYDVAIATAPATLAAMKILVGPERMMFGTDWPFMSPHVMAEQVAIQDDPATHTAGERAAIDRGTALTLFPHLA